MSVIEDGASLLLFALAILVPLLVALMLVAVSVFLLVRLGRQRPPQANAA